MELFDPKKINFDFVKYFKIGGAISLLLTLISLALFYYPGLNYGIDFRGGVEARVRFAADSKIEIKELREVFEGKLEGLSVQDFNDKTAKDFLVMSQSDSKEDVSKRIKEALSTKYGAEGEKTWTVPQLDSVGRKVGADFRKSALLSLIYTCFLVTLYMYWRFDLRYSPGALACIFHDLILTCGYLIVTNAEFSTTVVAALLTLAGYSINDTVVVFDRIRETEHKMIGRTKKDIVNNAINSTLSRTIMTAGTTLIACAVLYFVGGPTLKDFAAALFFGIIVGTYSSAFVAAPLYLWADKKFSKQSGTQLATTKS